jgi:AraC-like DNA-binding protein
MNEDPTWRSWFDQAKNLKDYRYFYDIHNKKDDNGRNIANSLELSADDLMPRKYVLVSKHHRIYDIPITHSHDFVEINYMYSGSCHNIVNDRDLHMRKGDLLIMDTRVSHHVEPLTKDDTLVNILIIPQYAKRVIEELLPDNSDIASFIINTIYNFTRQPNFMFFQLSDCETLSEAMLNFFREYYSTESPNADALLSCYLKEILLLLDREYRDHPGNVFAEYKPNSTVAQVINYISKNCIDCSLDGTAKHFGYSSNYICKLLAKEADSGLIDLRNEFRLNLIEYKLHTTTDSVKKIAEAHGFSNPTYFYKLYKEYFGHMPREQ